MAQPRCVLIAAVFALALPVAAGAQQPTSLLPPAPPQQEEAEPQVPPEEKRLLEDPSPNFQPIRPAEPEAQPNATPGPAQPNAMPGPAQPTPAPVPAQPAPVPAPPPAETAPSPMAVPVPADIPPAAVSGLPLWALGVLVLAGAFLAGLFGILAAVLMRSSERRERRRAVAAILATELETRRLAFDAVPLPPNAEAGVSFVSSVTSLAGIDAGFRSVQGQVHLLPEKLAAHVSVHYAAVQRVSDFVKGQSLAAAVRMLQANRLGGHPCPDAGAMRDAHEELGAAFRGVEKLVQSLRAPL